MTSQSQTPPSAGPRMGSLSGPDGAAPPDPRPLLLRAGDQLVEVVAGLAPAELAGPTPCTEFDVRALARHVVAVLRRVAAAPRGVDVRTLPTVAEEVGDADLGTAARAALVDVRAVWGDDAVLDRIMLLPFGELPGRVAGFAYAQECATHAWDLATAVGRADGLDPSIAAPLVEVSRRAVPAELRGGPVPFGAVVAVADDAGPYPRLVGWLGRDPSWTA